MTDSTVLRLRDVTLTYPDGPGRITVLDDVSLTARAGELTALTGPSGAGKSSLLAVAAGLIRPDRGQVLLHDGPLGDGAAGAVDLAGLSRRALTTMRRERIGIVFQQANLLSGLRAVEQLEVTGHLGRGADLRRVRERARELLDAVGLADRADAYPAQLSGGQRQRVNIARALMGSPSLLVVDEPTSALDTERGEAVVELIAALARRSGAAALVVTHDERHSAVMDRRYRMIDGHVREFSISINTAPA